MEIKLNGKQIVLCIYLLASIIVSASFVSIANVSDMVVALLLFLVTLMMFIVVLFLPWLMFDELGKKPRQPTSEEAS